MNSYLFVCFLSTVTAPKTSLNGRIQVIFVTPCSLILTYPDLLFLAFLDFLAFLLFEEFLAFLSVFPFFPRILGVRKRRKILAFLVVFLAFSPKTKEKKIRVINSN